MIYWIKWQTRAVHEGLIDQLGSLGDALNYLYGEIERRG